MPYTITIDRRATTGTLRFEDGSVKIETTCWWDPDVVVDAGTYTGYATRMASKDDGSDGGKREGIWFGTDVPCNHGAQSFDGIFIHKGTSAAWSDGCIVCAETDVVSIWQKIQPKDSANVTIVVTDLVAAGAPWRSGCFIETSAIRPPLAIGSPSVVCDPA